ncbi:MAG: hypothetical protein NC911_11015 [Candidatus Omnitrophica bacterium]|nr:hypothetical protein [Candidatus Omnitrophota bacterium]MCM8770172.1 hypothetical protein [Candidatus Omnitrophota bacterium]
MYAEELEKLVNLQHLDLEISDLEAQLEVIPGRIMGWQAELKKQEEQLALLHKEYSRLKITRREQEGELRAIEEEVNRLQKVLDQVKTNKEYTSVLNEIRIAKEKQSQVESLVLESMEKEDDFANREQEILFTLEKRKSEISKKQHAEETRRDQLKALLEEKKALRQEKQKEIDSGLLDMYERIRQSKKDGVAICLLEVNEDRASCSGCSVFVPVYIVEKVKRKTEMVNCENCSRILYL